MSTASRRAIYGKMSGDTTLNNLLATPPAGFSKSIFYQVAPPEAQHPFVIFQKQSGTPTQAFQDASAYENEVWLIKGVDREGRDNFDASDNADAIAGRLNTLLTDGSISISGATQMYLRRESDIDFAEDSDGVVYRHAGSLYRLLYE